MTKVIFDIKKLKPTSPYGYTNKFFRLMVKDKPHKIFIIGQDRDDILEGYPDGFILEINKKRIGCYWLYTYACEIDDLGKSKGYRSLHEYRYEVTEDRKIIWCLHEVGIKPSLSSTNSYTTHQYFDSEAEMIEGLQFITEVFSEYDGNIRTELVEDRVDMVWTKKRLSEIHFTSSLQNKIDNGELIKNK